jgi:hypothetical protein
MPKRLFGGPENPFTVPSDVAECQEITGSDCLVGAANLQAISWLFQTWQRVWGGGD